MDWIDEQRKKILNSPIDINEFNQAMLTDLISKRKYYACGDKFVPVDTIPSILDDKLVTEESTPFATKVIR